MAETAGVVSPRADSPRGDSGEYSEAVLGTLTAEERAALSDWLRAQGVEPHRRGLAPRNWVPVTLPKRTWRLAAPLAPGVKPVYLLPPTPGVSRPGDSPGEAYPITEAQAAYAAPPAPGARRPGGAGGAGAGDPARPAPPAAGGGDGGPGGRGAWGPPCGPGGGPRASPRPSWPGAWACPAPTWPGSRRGRCSRGSRCCSAWPTSPGAPCASTCARTASRCVSARRWRPPDRRGDRSRGGGRGRGRNDALHHRPAAQRGGGLHGPRARPGQHRVAGGDGGRGPHERAGGDHRLPGGHHAAGGAAGLRRRRAGRHRGRVGRGAPGGPVGEADRSARAQGAPRPEPDRYAGGPSRDPAG